MSEPKTEDFKRELVFLQSAVDSVRMCIHTRCEYDYDDEYVNSLETLLGQLRKREFEVSSLLQAASKTV